MCLDNASKTCILSARLPLPELCTSDALGTTKGNMHFIQAAYEYNLQVCTGVDSHLMPVPAALALDTYVRLRHNSLQGRCFVLSTLDPTGFH